MSSRIPLPEQAPAARPIAEYTVMSWHRLVSSGFVSLSESEPPLFKLLMTPLRGSINSRGLETTFAFCGAATGTLITSMRNSAVLGFLSGVPPEQPGNSSSCRTNEVPET